MGSLRDALGRSRGRVGKSLTISLDHMGASTGPNSDTQCADLRRTTGTAELPHIHTPISTSRPRELSR